MSYNLIFFFIIAFVQFSRLLTIQQKNAFDMMENRLYLSCIKVYDKLKQKLKEFRKIVFFICL